MKIRLSESLPRAESWIWVVPCPAEIIIQIRQANRIQKWLKYTQGKIRTTWRNHKTSAMVSTPQQRWWVKMGPLEKTAFEKKEGRWSFPRTVHALNTQCVYKQIIIPRENVRGRKKSITEWWKSGMQTQTVTYTNNTELLQAFMVTEAANPEKCTGVPCCVSTTSSYPLTRRGQARGQSQSWQKANWLLPVVFLDPQARKPT